MDNKLLKRIVAVAASAVMLTSSVLATELTVGEDAWNDTAKSLTFSYDPAGATKVTYLAYAAREATAEELADENFKADYTDTTNSTKYVFGEIVAVNQIDSASGALAAGEETVPVNGELLTVGVEKTAATHIVLMSGSDLASTADVKVVPTTKVQSTFTVTFMSATAGTAHATINDVAKDTAINGLIPATNPTKDGYAFKGWYTDEALTTPLDTNATVQADMTLYPKFVEMYTVTFLDATGAAIGTPASVETGTAISTLIPADPTKEDSGYKRYAFVGWYTDEALTVKLDKTSTVTAAMTLYPKFAQVGVYGDANGDGRVTSADIGQIKGYLNNDSYSGKAGTVIANYQTANGSEAKYGDANGTTGVTSADIGQIKGYLNNDSYSGKAGTDMVIVKD